jgi:protein SCO1/2
MAALLVVAGASAAPGSDDVPAPPLPLEKLFGGPFELVDHDGMVRTDRDFHGRHVLLYFGYTYCPDICPTSLQEMAAALEQLGEAGGDVQPVFVTIDPKRDTQMVLKEYVAQFGERFVGLGGTEQQTARLAKAYRLHRVKVVPDWSEAENDYLVDHSSLTFLLGPDGKVVTLFPHNTPAETMAMRLRAYLMPGADG